MAENPRAQRLAKQIHAIVASAIEREVKDRRLELVTITDVRVTGDLHDATVYYTVRGRDIDEEPDFDAAAEALHRARGQLRKKVGDIRHTLPPGIRGPFFNDEFGTSFGNIYALTGEGFDYAVLKDYAEVIDGLYDRASRDRTAESHAF